MKKVFCFGELLLRFSPALQQEWIRTQSMPVHIGGAELNVAKALAKWNIPVAYCSSIPNNYISAEILASLEKENIATSSVLLQGDRIGSYTLPMGADLKNAGVIYDRAYSAFSFLKPGMINWEEVLKGYEWFHYSAISPALNENVVAVCEEALQVASKMGLTISVDLNYRAKLWQYGKQPDQVMPDLSKYCQVIMGNIWSANKLLGTTLNPLLNGPCEKEFYVNQAKLLSEEIFTNYPNCQYVANTYRFTEGEEIDYYATLTTRKQHEVSKAYHINSTIDKVGSGDCFMAGLIYGDLNGFTPAEQINFAASAAFGKLQEVGDSTKQTVETIESRYKI
jgi:2-dehydro-3-deoxygluconokinase